MQTPLAIAGFERVTKALDDPLCSVAMGIARSALDDLVDGW